MTSLTDVNFSSTLPHLANLIVDSFDESTLTSGTFLRDGFGRLSFYSVRHIKASEKKAFNKLALQKLGLHVSPHGALQDADSPGFEAIKQSEKFSLKLTVQDKEASVCFVDRRFFGRDWLHPPVAPAAGAPPILVFNSIKGGVGRSTALFVLSIALSRAGKNVLLVDLDLEAPGLGALLFDGSAPTFGVLDYLVESALGGVSDDDLPMFISSSTLIDREIGQGRVDLMPAVGALTIQNPKMMMAKLSRALVEVPGDTGRPTTLIQQINEMIIRASSTSHYDVVLVDARAGLSEITASPIIGLGATNLFFATDHPHSYEGYRYLLSHLSMLPVDASSDWRSRVHFVHAKAKASMEARELFNDKLYDVVSDTFYEEDEGDDVFNYSYDDKTAPHSPFRIFFSSEFIDADPVENASLLESDVYNAAFGSFIDAAFRVLGFNQEVEDAAASF
ncbi:AAA family ATPase [Sphingobium yanoikuyae]|uniref:AAA family ATPase n=1 Tax=Sphingobium yanoikuyae TaxID=13690 RepID=A0A6P1GII2_SPHYA|nr:AAA family ATPase [Sphingobium yanoikuyae]QHD68347.1 AAA family ATPase [Sphingobium yanoikuyae]